MRQITRSAIEAFCGGHAFSKDNTQVVVVPADNNNLVHASSYGPGVYFLLHGNLIAWRPLDDLNAVYVKDGGWQTATTKERLNGLPGVSVHQKAGQWYLNGQKWSGEWAFPFRNEPFAAFTGGFTYSEPA